MTIRAKESKVQSSIIERIPVDMVKVKNQFFPIPQTRELAQGANVWDEIISENVFSDTPFRPLPKYQYGGFRLIDPNGEPRRNSPLRNRFAHRLRRFSFRGITSHSQFIIRRGCAMVVAKKPRSTHEGDGSHKLRATEPTGNLSLSFSSGVTATSTTIEKCLVWGYFSVFAKGTTARTALKTHNFLHPKQYQQGG